jgi:hypothetical protein
MKRAASFLVLLALTGPLHADDRDRVVVPSRAQRSAPPGTRFDQVVADGSKVHMTMTNYGFYGNNYFSRDASLEYPANRGYEHLVRGGLWVGAKAQDVSEFTGVTTGTVDAAQGATSPGSTEFTPGGREVLRRSTLLNSEFFSRSAVSELDVVSDFDDLTPTTADNNSEAHRPLRIAVHHENYQWSFGLFQHCLFFHIEIKNTGALMESVWVGIYSEFASGNKGGYVNWPPSAGDPSGLGFFYRRKWVQADDSLKLVREHYCAEGPAPDACQLQVAPYWIGLRYLGSRGVAQDTTTRKLTLAGWNYFPGLADRNQDIERYALMNSGKWETFNVDSLQPHGIATGSPDPIVLFSVGPFPSVPRNSTVSADFAIVGGAEIKEIQRNSKFAQFAYDNNYVVPVPPPSPRMHVVSRDNALDIYWDNSSEQACDVTSIPRRDFEGYRVYIGEDPDTLARVAQFDSNVAPGDTSGFNTGFPMPVPRIHRDSLLTTGEKIMLPHYAEFNELRCDSVCQRDSVTCELRCDPVPCVLDTTRYQYKYTVGNLRNGFKYYVAVTAYDLGNTQIEPLESGFDQNRVVVVPGPAPGEARAQKPVVFPNPYRVEARWDQGQNVRDHYLWFAGLPARCKIKILTLSGDLVFEKDFDGATYQGEGARGIFNPSQSLGPPVLSGATFGWNMITTEGQAVATGLYLFSVEDRATGDRTIGKFLIVKSDRDR